MRATWLQRAVRDGRVFGTKVPGSLNPTDLGSKHMEAKVITQAWQMADVIFLQGRSGSVVRAEHLASGAKMARADCYGCW